MTNPLLAEWDTPFGIAPFDRIRDDHFAPALEAALADHRREIDTIAANPEPPSFANTIEALEAAGRTLDRVLGVFFTVAGADSTPEREALQRAFSPKLAAHFSEISGNKALFARVQAVWAARDTLGLTDEQTRVLMLTHRGFVRAGAALDGAADRPVVVALHHPPLRTGIRFIDAIGLENAEALADAVAGHRGPLRLLAGHVHGVHHGMLAGHPVTTAPSTCSAFALDRRETAPTGFMLGPLGFAVLDAAPGGVWTACPLAPAAGPFPF